MGISSLKKMCFMCFAQRQVELRRLSNQLPLLGQANSLCDVANDIVTTYKHGHQWFWNCVFRNTRAPFDRVMYIFVKLCVFCLLFYKVRPLVVRKNTNSRFLRFFVRSVQLFRSLGLTPMDDQSKVSLRCLSHLLSYYSFPPSIIYYSNVSNPCLPPSVLPICTAASLSFYLNWFISFQDVSLSDNRSSHSVKSPVHKLSLY